jgi:DNA-binding NarL/FixJ family response regulator
MATPQRPGRPAAKSGVLLVDDHAIVRQGIAALIEQEDDLFVCGEAESAEEALEALRTTRPAICLADLSLAGIDGMEFVKRAKARFPHVPILILSMHDEHLYAERALRAGAKGYIMKREGAENLLDAIRRVLRGQVYLSERMAGRILERIAGGRVFEGASPADKLSDRELEVFRFLGQGLGTREIAERLHLSVKTIEAHRANIIRKLGLAGSSELVQQAVRWVSEEGRGRSGGA